MKKFMKSLLILSVAMCAFACGKDGVDPVKPKPTPKPDEGKVTFSFTTAALKRPASRVSGTELTNEAPIDNVWVLQFDKNDLTTGKLVVSEYFEGEAIADNAGTKSVSVALEDAASPRIYCVVNVGKDELKSLGKNTKLSTFEASTLKMVEGTAEQIPMIGYTDQNTATGTAVVELTRLIAKIKFTCEIAVPSTHKFTPTRVQLCDVANVAHYTPITAPTGDQNLYPDASTDNFFSYKEDEAIELTGKTFTKTWYLPENLRGVVAGLTATQKGKSNAPKFATCIEVSGDYEEPGKNVQDITYRVYPGADAAQDFNIVRNHSYSIKMKIEGSNPNDIRVEIEKGVPAGDYTDDQTWE